jgi:hypothetical protein
MQSRVISLQMTFIGADSTISSGSEISLVNLLTSQQLSYSYGTIFLTRKWQSLE